MIHAAAWTVRKSLRDRERITKYKKKASTKETVRKYSVVTGRDSDKNKSHCPIHANHIQMCSLLHNSTNDNTENKQHQKTIITDHIKKKKIIQNQKKTKI